MRVRPLLLLLLFCSLVSCGRKPSSEFDQRPAIPTAPVALPVPPPEAETPGGMNQDVRVGQDLRDPRISAEPGTDPSLSGSAPKAPTYTYVPVVSPRQLPGEKVPPVSPSQPVLPRTDLTKTTPPPPGTPLSVPPPPPAGPAPDAMQP